MKQRRRRQTMTASVLGALALATATLVGATTMTKLPPEQKQGSTAYMSGGVGKDQRAAIEHAAHEDGGARRHQRQGHVLEPRDGDL